MADDAFFALRDRAFDLAATGRFKQWNDIAYALQAEGFLPALITRFDENAQSVMMITRSCTQARS